MVAGHTDNCWMVAGYSGNCWMVAGHSGNWWMVAGHSGNWWMVAGHSGNWWMVSGHSGNCWMVAGHSGNSSAIPLHFWIRGVRYHDRRVIVLFDKLLCGLCRNMIRLLDNKRYSISYCGTQQHVFGKLTKWLNFQQKYYKNIFLVFWIKYYGTIIFTSENRVGL